MTLSRGRRNFIGGERQTKITVCSIGGFLWGSHFSMMSAAARRLRRKHRRRWWKWKVTRTISTTAATDNTTKPLHGPWPHPKGRQQRMAVATVMNTWWRMAIRRADRKQMLVSAVAAKCLCRIHQREALQPELSTCLTEASSYCKHHSTVVVAVVVVKRWRSSICIARHCKHASNALSSLTRAACRTAIACSLQTQAGAAAG